MKHTQLTSVVAAIILNATASFAATTEWAMPADFNTIAEPPNHGVWSLGRCNVGAGDFAPYTEYAKTPQWKYWNFSDADVWENGKAWLSFKPVFGTKAGEFVLHPGRGVDKGAALRWTAPAAGAYQVKGTYRGNAAGGDRDVVIRCGDKSILDKKGTVSDEPFNFEVNVAQGETLDFQVGNGSTWTVEATGFEVRITPAETNPS
jgi:hypothetical protein